MTHEALAREVIDVIWNRHELDRIPEFYTEDFVSHQPKDGFRWDPGQDGLRALLEVTRQMFPDYTENIEDAVAEGDRVVLRLRNTGTLAERVKGNETSSYADWMSASRLGSLIQATLGSSGGVGGRWRNRAGFAL